MQIDSSVASIWEIITKPKNLELVHPFCKSNETIDWPGVGSKDILVYHSGLKYIREFMTWDKEKGYSLLIGEKNKDRSFVGKALILLNLLQPNHPRNIQLISNNGSNK